jgi:oxygen-independent coproporphyrinogen-3 oxidase
VGVTRVSVGVQDFDDDVQAAIGRHQSFAATKAAVDAFRHGGVRSVNIDLMYGLPHQTRRSIDRTLRRVLELEPDRIAAFGYAHLPARLKHQRLIDEAALPDVVERYAQSRRIARRLEASDYVRIGLDHFAKPGDPLARGPVNRNFQGYTTDSASALLGIGASAIGRLPQGYVQNAVAAGDYIRRIRDCGLAAARGIELSMDDRVRAYVIERLMCDGTFSRSDIERRFGAAAGPVLADAELLVQSDQGGLVAATADGFRVTEAGRPFVRTICACFDAYMGTEGARYSPGV